MSKIPNPNKETFLKFLNQGKIIIGLLEVDPAETYFWSNCSGWEPFKEHMQKSNVIQEFVSDTEDDECSMPVSVIWKFTFFAGKRYSLWSSMDIKEYPEEVLYIDFYGYNRSHEGRTYEGWREVKPRTETVIVYE